MRNIDVKAVVSVELPGVEPIRLKDGVIPAPAVDVVEPPRLLHSWELVVRVDDVLHVVRNQPPGKGVFRHVAGWIELSRWPHAFEFLEEVEDTIHVRDEDKFSASQPTYRVMIAWSGNRIAPTSK